MAKVVKKILFGVISFCGLFGMAIALDLLQGIDLADFLKEAKFYFGTLKLDDYFSLSLWAAIIGIYLYKVPNDL